VVQGKEEGPYCPRNCDTQKAEFFKAETASLVKEAVSQFFTETPLHQSGINSQFILLAHRRGFFFAIGVAAFFLRKLHVGEMYADIWSEKITRKCKQGSDQIVVS
jgi:hypothetical protein